MLVLVEEKAKRLKIRPSNMVERVTTARVD